MSVPTIPGYSELEQIGAGGFGVVYRATQTAVGREVALKLLHLATADEDTERRFQRECRVVGSLSWHPHIAAVLDAGADAEGRSYLAFELLSDGSLGDRLAATGPIPWSEAVRFAIQMADALAAAHAEEVLHRDIKPDNILIDRLGRAKLADFGIAQMHDGHQTKSGVITASLSHVAPEVLNGQRATKLSDLYLLGSTIFELVAGKPPFGKVVGGEVFAAMRRIANEQAPRLDGLDGITVPAGLADVVEQTLRKDPGERFESAAALGLALRSVQQANNEPLTAMPFVEATGDPAAVAERPAPPVVTPSPGEPSLATESDMPPPAQPFVAPPGQRPPPPPASSASPPPPPKTQAPTPAQTTPPPPKPKPLGPQPAPRQPEPSGPQGREADQRTVPATGARPKRAIVGAGLLVLACVGGFFLIRALQPVDGGPPPLVRGTTTPEPGEVARGQVEPTARSVTPTPDAIEPTVEPLVPIATELTVSDLGAGAIGFGAGFDVAIDHVAESLGPPQETRFDDFDELTYADWPNGFSLYSLDGTTFDGWQMFGDFHPDVIVNGLAGPIVGVQFAKEPTGRRSFWPGATASEALPTLRWLGSGLQVEWKPEGGDAVLDSLSGVSGLPDLALFKIRGGIDTGISSDGRVQVTGNRVNVRLTPSIDSAVVGVAFVGDEYDRVGDPFVDARGREWMGVVPVDENSFTGWMATEFLEDF